MKVEELGGAGAAWVTGKTPEKIEDQEDHNEEGSHAGSDGGPPKPPSRAILQWIEQANEAREGGTDWVPKKGRGYADGFFVPKGGEVKELTEENVVEWISLQTGSREVEANHRPSLPTPHNLFHIPSNPKAFFHPNPDVEGGGSRGKLHPRSTKP
jgi:hypothetical protein